MARFMHDITTVFSRQQQIMMYYQFALFHMRIDTMKKKYTSNSLLEIRIYIYEEWITKLLLDLHWHHIFIYVNI